MFSFNRDVDRHLPVAWALLCAAAAAPAFGGFTVFSVGGNTTPASIQPTVDAFRAALGNPNNANSPGPLASGRREINWDGGGATTATSTAGPLAAFSNTRGGRFTTAGSGFLQTPVDDPAFTGINSAYSTTFGAFSPVRIFTPVGSNVTEATFSIPGTNGAATAIVVGFGAVFSDVDLAATTKLEFLDLGGNVLTTLNAPVGSGPSASLSFIGGVANAGEQIGRVRITTGNSALGPNDGGAIDVVVMDDFLYSEPIPEPACTFLAAAVLMLARRNRRD